MTSSERQPTSSYPYSSVGTTTDRSVVYCVTIAANLGQSLHICQASRTHVHAVGFRPTVADNVVSHFAARRFDCLIDLTLGYPKSFSDDLEVVDERFHLRLHLLAVGQDDLRGIRLDW